MPGFLIKYNRRTGNVAYKQFPDLRSATKARLRFDRDRSDKNIEIVSVTGSSIDEIKSTHSRYFLNGKDSEMALS